MITPLRRENLKWIFLVLVIMLFAGSVFANIKANENNFVDSLIIEKHDLVFGESIKINIDTKGLEYEVVILDPNYMSISLGTCNNVCSYTYKPDIWIAGNYKVLLRLEGEVIYEEKVKYMENILKIEEIGENEYLIKVSKNKVSADVIFEIINSQGYVYIMHPILVNGYYEAKVPSSFDMQSLKAIDTDGKEHLANLEFKNRVSENNEIIAVDKNEDNYETTSEERVRIIQSKTQVGQPVNWSILINNTDEITNKIIIPKTASNVNVREKKLKTYGRNIEYLEKDNLEELGEKYRTNIGLGLIKDQTEQIISIKDVLKEKKNRKNIGISSISNNLNLTEKYIELEQFKGLIEIRYTTPAPQKREEVTKKGKKVVVYTDEEYGYENVSVQTQIETKVKVENKDDIRLYWIEENKYLDFEVLDTDADGYVDGISWNAEHLSTQTFEIIIEITTAIHLDENGNFLEDIYEFVYKLDGIWSPIINENQIIRIGFKENLTRKNDITIYPRVVSGKPYIEVYEAESGLKIAEFKNIKSEEYNKVYLIGLNKKQDTFDLIIKNGSIEFDYIVDPSLYYLRIQRGVSTLNSAINTESIDMVNMSNAFILHNVRSSNSVPATLQTIAEFSDSETLSISRYGTTSADVSWEIIESPIFDVQRNIESYDSTTSNINVNIEEVNLTEAFIIVDNKLDSTTSNQYIRGLWTGKFVNSTTISLTRAVTGSVGVVSWQVVEAQRSRVQSNSLSTTAISGTQNLGQEINLNNTLLLFSASSTNTGLTDWNVRGSFVDNQTVEFVRGRASGTMAVEWFAIEHPFFDVETGQVTVSGSSAINENIGLVNRSITFSTATWSTTGTGTANANARLTSELLNDTTLQFTKGTSSQTQTVQWQTIQIYMDKLAPEVIINTPLEKYYGPQEFPIIVNITLNEYSNSVLFSLDEGENNHTMISSDGINFNATIDYLDSGNYDLKIYAKDTWGNLNDTEMINFDVDKFGPVINIIRPEVRVYASGDNLEFNHTVYDEGVGTLDICQWNIDGGVNQTVNCNENITFSVGDGVHTLYFYVNDSLGNSNATQVDFQVISGAPVVVLEKPENMIWINNKFEVEFNYTAMYKDGIESCELYANWSGDWVSEDIDPEVENASINTFIVDLTLYSDDEYEWNVLCNNSAGSYASALENYTFNVDTQEPYIDYTYGTQLDDAQLQRNWIYVNISLNENNFKNITFELYHKGSGEKINSSIYESEILDINWTNLESSNISYEYNVTVYDLAGNMNNTQTREILLYDTSEPTLILISPINTIYNYNESILIDYEVQDLNLDSCWFKLNDGENILFENCTTTYIDVPEGNNNLKIYANDTLGQEKMREVDFVANNSYFVTDEYKVQRGSLTLNGESVENIDSVEMDKSFILLNQRSSSSLPDTLQVISSFQNPSSVVFKNYAGGDVDVNWEVITGPAFNVQRGAESYLTTDSLIEIEISNVNLSNSFVLVDNRLASSTDTNFIAGLWTGRFVNSTTLRFERTSNGESGELSWQVVSWDGAQVLSQSESFSTASQVVNLVEEINLNNSILFFSKSSTSNGLINWNIKGNFTDNQTLDFSRGGTSGTINIEWFVVSHPLLEVKSGQITVSGSTSMQETITEVNENSAFVVPSWDSTGGGNINANSHLTTGLISSSLLSFTKGTGSQTQIVDWQVGEIKDKALPEINIHSPLDINYTNATILINLTTWDDVFVESVWYEFNDINITYTEPVYREFLEGDNIFKAWVKDSSEKVSEKTVNFYVDSVKPEIEIISPLNITYSQEEILLNLSVTDVNLEDVWYNWNGTNDTYLVPVNVSFNEGQNIIFVWANDSFGNTQEINLTFNVELYKQGISLISPKLASGQNIGDIEFKFNVTSRDSVDNCSLYIGSSRVNTSDFVLVDEITVMTESGFNVSRYEWYVNCSTPVDSFVSDIFYFDTINISNFEGVNVNISDIDISNIENFSLENSGKGRINFTTKLNLSNGADINSVIKIDYNNITIKSELDNRFNVSAILRLVNLSYSMTPVILKDGNYCEAPDCEIVYYDNNSGEFVFNVTHFTSYTTKTNSELMIWDESDVIGGGVTKYINDNVNIYTNYTDYLTGESVNATQVYCEISFNDSGVWDVPVNMTFNESSKLYEFNISFENEGKFYYNISCDGTSEGYEFLSLIDYLDIYIDYSSLNIYFVSPTPENYETIIDDRLEFKAHLNENNLSEFNWSFDENTYSIYDDSVKLLLNLDNNAQIGETSNLAQDISNNNYNASITNALFITGMYGNALQFNGGDAVATVLNYPELNSKTQATISAWVKQNTLSENQYLLWADGNVLIQFGDSQNIAGAQNLRVRWNLQGDWRDSHTAVGVLDAGLWNYWTFVFEEGETRIYKNGIKVYNDTDSYTQISAVSPNYDFGTRTGDGLNGFIDEIRIYNRSLTEQEIIMSYYSNIKKVNNSMWQFDAVIKDLENKEYEYLASYENLTGYSEETQTRYVNVIVPNSRLDIWDQSDISRGGQIMFINESILFYANYTNITSGANITGSNVSCNITFDDYSDSMTYNSTFEMYLYNRSFTTSGDFDYMIECNGSYYGYDTLNKTSSVTVSPSETIIRNLVLESDSGTNHTTDNLTCSYSIAGAAQTSVVDWIMNNQSIMLVNMPFEGNDTNALIDYSKNQNNGTYHNDAYWEYGTGVDYQGNVVFDGTNDWVQILHSNSFAQEYEKLTIETWLYDTAGDGQPRGIISKRDSSSSNRAFSLFIYTGNYINLDIGSDRHASTTALTTNAWNHLVVVFDGTQVSTQRKRFYINGQPAGVSSSSMTSIPVTPADIYIGILNTNYGVSWEGRIGSIKIYNDSLTYDQIKLLSEKNNNVIHKNETSIGENYSCVVTAFSDRDMSQSYYSNDIEIKDKLPVITQLYPENNYVTEFNDSVNITINATVQDDYGLSNCSLWHNYNGVWHENQTIVFNYENYFSYEELEFELNNLKKKQFVWNIKCYDSLNQLGIGVNRSINIIDIVKPKVDVLAPSAGNDYVVGQQIEIRANVTDNDDIMIVRAKLENENGIEYVTLHDDDSDNVYNGTYEIFILGVHNVTIIARDLSNNVNDTQETWFNVTYTTGAAIYCTSSPCIAGNDLIASRDSIDVGEPNQPNTIDGCTDGTSGTYLDDESLENITIRSLNGSNFRAGDTVEMIITGNCLNDGSEDNINFVYANTSSVTPNWKVMHSLTCPAGGTVQVSYSFVLENRTGIHSVRGILQYQGVAGDTCGTGAYDDNDDLEFLVLSPRESKAPLVEILEPLNTQKYNFSDIVDIRVNVTDASLIDTVYALIKIEKKEWNIILEDYNVDNIYTGSFSETLYLENFTLKVYANDSFGNVNNSENITFEVIDSGSLTINEKGCVPSTIEMYENVTCTAEIYDENIPLDTIFATVIYPNLTEINVTVTNISGNYSFVFNKTDDVVDYEVTWFANNTVGSFRYGIDSFRVIEYNKPLVTINNPYDGQNYNTSMQVPINVTVTDDTRVDSIYARIRQPSGHIDNIELDNVGNNIYIKTYTNTSYGGNYIITIYAYDLSGNLNNTENTWINVTYVTQSAIYCDKSPCIADSSLIFGKGNMGNGGNEPNQPNTIDICKDGNGGNYLTDESLENITVRNLNGTKFRAYDTIEVNVTAHCWLTTPSEDNVNFVYANTSGVTPNWKVIDSVTCPTGGFTVISRTFVLDNIIGIQAIRGIIQYQGAVGDTCGTGGYDDNDDLEFFVYRMRETDFEIKEVKYPLSVYEGMNVTINATINNRGTTNVSNLPVEFYDLTNDVRIGDIQYISFLDSEENVTLSVNFTADIGDRNIEIRIDPQNTITESNETNNNETLNFNVPAWSVFYGKITPKIFLGDALNNTAIEWDYNTFSGNVFITTSGSIDWNSLQALGRNATGQVSGSDFSELDNALNMQNYNDNITAMYTIDGSIPRDTNTINVHGADIENVPVINSSLTNVFKTGILWDTSGDLSGSYDSSEKERIVMVSNIVQNGAGSYGTYDYEIRVPTLLREYNQPSGEIYVYVEIK
jgi:hypothetical protein